MDETYIKVKGEWKVNLPSMPNSQLSAGLPDQRKMRFAAEHTVQ
jgi:hypothetical protein